MNKIHPWSCYLANITNSNKRNRHLPRFSRNYKFHIIGKASGSYPCFIAERKTKFLFLIYIIHYYSRKVLWTPEILAFFILCYSVLVYPHFVAVYKNDKQTFFDLQNINGIKFSHFLHFSCTHNTTTYYLTPLSKNSI